jgi:hypothetical protein
MLARVSGRMGPVRGRFGNCDRLGTDWTEVEVGSARVDVLASRFTSAGGEADAVVEYSA